MAGLYPYIKFLHVLLAIMAVGFNMSYGIWLAPAAREPVHLGHVLRGLQTLASRFANPAYFLLLVTGLANVFIGGIPLTTPWILGGLILWFVLLGLGSAAYTPTLRKQIAALEASGPDSPDYRGLASRGQMVGIVLALILVVIVLLMDVKPGG